MADKTALKMHGSLTSIMMWVAFEQSVRSSVINLKFARFVLIDVDLTCCPFITGMSLPILSSMSLET